MTRYRTLGRSSPKISSETERRSTRRPVFDNVRRRDDLCTRDEVGFADAARFRAGAARPELATVVKKLADDILERCEAFLLDTVRVAIGCQSHPLNREQDDCLLISGRRDDADHEWQGGSFGVLITVRCID